MEPTIEEVVPAKPEKAKKVEKSEVKALQVTAQEGFAELKPYAPPSLEALDSGGWQKILSVGDSHMSAYDIDGVGCLVEVTRGANSNLVFVPGAKVAVKNDVKYLRN